MNTTGGEPVTRPASRRAGAVTPRRPGAVRLAALVRAGAVAGAALAVGLAGCGSGSGTPTLALPALVSRVNAICATYAVRMEALAAPAFAPASVTASELGTVAAYLGHAVPLLQAEQSSIEAVGEPQTDRDMFARVLTALAARVRDEVSARNAAHAGDLRAFRAAVAADQQDSIRLAGAAQQFGLAKCV